MKMSDLPISKRNNTKKNSWEFGVENDYKQPLSLKKIVAAENKHNEKVQKKLNELGGIPVVYGGMNTV